MNNIFLKTYEEAGKNRLKALPGQKMEDGSAINPNLSVKSTKLEVRQTSPIGTTFYCPADSFENCGGFYQVTKLFRIADAPADVLAEYSVFSAGMSESSSGTTAGSLLSKLKSDPKYSVPTIEKDGFFVKESDWYYLVRNITKKINTLITGPTGVGKTEIIRLIADRLGMEMHWYDMGTMIDATASLLGTHRLCKGDSKWDYADFALQIQKPGIILLDELSRAPMSTCNLLFPCLDKRRSLPVELACEGDLRSIPVHEDCVFVATANVTGLNGDYSGTNELDDALVNRFEPLELDYLKDSVERDLLVKVEKIDAKEADIVVRVANDIRRSAAERTLSKPISTRETLAIASLIHDGFVPDEALRRVLLPLYPGTTTDGERSIVIQKIISR